MSNTVAHNTSFRCDTYISVSFPLWLLVNSLGCTNEGAVAHTCSYVDTPSIPQPLTALDAGLDANTKRAHQRTKVLRSMQKTRTIPPCASASTAPVYRCKKRLILN